MYRSISCQNIFHSIYAFTEKDILWLLVSIFTYFLHLVTYISISYRCTWRYIYYHIQRQWCIMIEWFLLRWVFFIWWCIYHFHAKVYFSIFCIIFRGKDIWNGWENWWYQRHNERKIPICSIYVSYICEASNYIYIVVILSEVRGICLSKKFIFWLCLYVRTDGWKYVWRVVSGLIV